MLDARVEMLDAKRVAIVERLRSLFLARLNLDVTEADTDLFATGLIDSLVFVELLMALEQEFGIAVDVNNLDLDDFRTLPQIADWIVAPSGSSGVHGASGTGPRLASVREG